MSYSVSWRRHRTLSRCGMGAFAASLLAVVLGFWIQSYPTARPLVPPLGVAFIAFAATFFGLLITQSYFHCPRCGKLFSRRSGWSRLQVGRKCVHCGLELYHDA